MTAHERMVHGLRLRLNCASYTNSLLLKRRETKAGPRFCVGSGPHLDTLEEALLKLADAMGVDPHGPIEYPDALLRLSEIRTQLGKTQDQVSQLKTRIAELQSALRPWANLEHRFVTAWGKLTEWHKARELLGIESGGTQ